ncbi:MAG: hypothetical protein M3394_02905 [Actinomycetota bacterium]|nr:hypothetical protein [Actinomycetota bacterium]
MNRRIVTLVAAGTAAAFALAMPLTAAPKGTDHATRQTVTAQGCEGGTLVIDAPNTLWPPNHKYAPLSATADHSSDSGAITLETTGTHDQYEGSATEGDEAKGSGNTIDDIIERDDQAGLTSGEQDSKAVAKEEGTNVVTTLWGARAERAGTIKDGRTYTFTATATFSGGNTCTASATFNVPHDMRPSNRTAPAA